MLCTNIKVDSASPRKRIAALMTRLGLQRPSYPRMAFCKVCPLQRSCSARRWRHLDACWLCRYFVMALAVTPASSCLKLLTESTYSEAPSLPRRRRDGALAVLKETTQNPGADRVKTLQQLHNSFPIKSSMASWQLAGVMYLHLGLLCARLIQQLAM